MNKVKDTGLRLNIVPVQAAFCLLLVLLLAACGDATTAAPAATTAPAASTTTAGAATTAATTSGMATTAATTTGAAMTTASAMTTSAAATTTGAMTTSAAGATTTAAGDTTMAATTPAATTAPAGGTTGAATTTNGGTSAAATAGSVKAPQGWNQLNSTEGKFSILMPGNPQKQSQTVNASGQNIDVISYQATQNEQNTQVIYNVSYSDYSNEVIQSSEPNSILQGVINGQTKGINGVSQEEKAVTLGSYPGRQNTFKFTSSTGVNGNGMGRAYLAGNRLYQLLVAYPEDKKPADSDLNAFFDSFKITN